MRFGWIAALGVAFGLTTGPGTSLALTLNVLGGPGVKAQSEICPSGSLCPGTPTYTLIGTAGVSGFFTYDGVSSAGFSLTLTAPANFGGITLLAGSTFSAVGVPVIQTPDGTGIAISQFGSATGSASMLLSPSFPIIANTPFVSSLSCTIGTPADACGVKIGASGLTFTQPGVGNFDTFLTVNVLVPEPASLALLGAGIAALVMTRRRTYQG